MTKPEDWVYASMDALVNEHSLTLSSNQYEALVHVMSILGASFKKTTLMKRLIAGDMTAAHAEILRLAGNREGLEKTILETAAALFGKSQHAPQPDDPGPDPDWPDKPPPGIRHPATVMLWLLGGVALVLGALLLFA